MASNPDESSGRPSGPLTEPCSGCGSALAPGQRYCVSCGARRSSLPVPVAALVAALVRSAAAGSPPPEPVAEEEATPSGFAAWMPTPRAAATAVMLVLALGVVLGSVTGRVAQSAGLQTILLQMPRPAPEPEEAVEAAVSEGGGEAEAAAPETVVPLEEAISEAPVSEETLPSEPPPEIPSLDEFGLEEEERLPDVKHVFVIALGENGFEEAFGETSQAPYLSTELPEQGELLSNYYAVAPGGLANQVALISGQGPTPETAADCPNYTDLVPGTVSAEGQAEGDGCVYPAAVETLPDQLVAAELGWKSYVEDIGSAPDQPLSCRHPALGAPDPKREAAPGDAYVTWRNPFAYFHSILDEPECEERNVGLDALAADLKAAKLTPALSYLVPDLCHDGGAGACEPEATAAGVAEADEFLREVVPMITASPAYEEGGLIAITSTMAPQEGEAADDDACCVYPAYPNLPPPAAAVEEEATGPVRESGGGGRVGMLLLSQFVEAGSVSDAYYNHFSLLATIEELFGLEPLGYAADPALTAFGSSVFNADEDEEKATEGGGKTAEEPIFERLSRRR